MKCRKTEKKQERYEYGGTYKPEPMIPSIITLLKRKGLIKSLNKLIKSFYYIYISGYIVKKPFAFNNRKYYYLYHRYGYTLDSERAVEVPVVIKEIKANAGKHILEVGNVLSHYYNAHWDIIDKFEKGKGVINMDIIDFKPSSKYDLIVSISTLEHIGYDDPVKEPMKILKAIENLKENCLKSQGRIIATLPLGYNKVMDSLLFGSKLGFDKIYFMKRVSKDNIWEQITEIEAKSIKYDSPFRHANGIAVGVLSKTGKDWYSKIFNKKYQ